MMKRIYVIAFSFILATVSFGKSSYRNRLNSRKQLSLLTYQFTEYFLYFGHYDDKICSPQDLHNETNRMMSQSIDMCAPFSGHYHPRALSRDQISWRNNKDKKKAAKSGIDGGSMPSNQTDQTNSTARSAAANDGEESDSRNDKIHKYLIFVLLLPNHPYSQQLRHIITTVAPMYPSVTVVVGNAYGFKDLASRYFITSFPKIMFFKMGMFIGTYEGEEYSAPAVAAQIAEWTALSPRAIPRLLPPPSLTPSVQTYSWKIIEHLPAMTVNASSQSWLQELFRDVELTFFLPTPNLEPVMGTLESYRQWDAALFYLSGVYVIIRSGMMLIKLRR